MDLRYCQLSHINLIGNWLKFYNKHLDTIVHGEFIPEFYYNSLPIIRFIGKKEQIIGLYEDAPVTLDFSRNGGLYVLNGSSRPFIDVSATNANLKVPVTARNKFGQIIYTQYVSFPTSRLEVEPGGSIEFGEIWNGPDTLKAPAAKEKKKGEKGGKNTGSKRKGKA